MKRFLVSVLSLVLFHQSSFASLQSSELIAAVVESETGIEVYLNKASYWQQKNSLIDSFSKEETASIQKIAGSAKLCSLITSSFEPCEASLTKAEVQNNLKIAGIKVNPQFQVWAEKLAKN